MKKLKYSSLIIVIGFMINGCGVTTKANDNLKVNGTYKLLDKSVDISKLPSIVNVNYITEIKIVDKENKKLTYLFTKVSEDGKILESTKHLSGNYRINCKEENNCKLYFRSGTKQFNGEVSIKLDNNGNLSKYNGKLMKFKFLSNN